MSELLDRQWEFSRKIALLISWAYGNGYKITLGEAYRTPEQARLNAKRGIGIAQSLHCSRLAMDLNVFHNDRLLTSTTDLLPIGEQWESMGGSWGGRFTRPDTDHFSLAYQGFK